MKIVSSQTNIRNAIFDQRSTRPPEVGVSRWHRHTDGHGDSMTNSAQWGRVGENCVAVDQHYLVSFKLPFLTYQSNIRELWVVPQVLIGSGSVLEVIHLVYIIG